MEALSDLPERRARERLVVILEVEVASDLYALSTLTAFVSIGQAAELSAMGARLRASEREVEDLM
jgi:hypothetical protein